MKFDAHAGAVRAAAFGHSGRLLASRGDDGHVGMWQVTNTKSTLLTKVNLFKASQQDSQQQKGLMSDVAWASLNKTFYTRRVDESFSIGVDPLGQLLACVTDGRVTFLDGPTWQMRKGPGSGVCALAFDPSGRTLCTASEEGLIIIWQRDSWKAIKQVSEHRSRINSVAFDNTGNLLCSASEDGTIRIRRIGEDKSLRTLEGHSGGVSSIAFTADGKLLASKSKDSTIRLWNVDAGAIVAETTEISSRSEEPGIAFHPSLPILASVGTDDSSLNFERDAVVHLWELDYTYLLRRIGAKSVTYAKSAKIVLVGESNVGKSFLAHRIATGQAPDNTLLSTHGMKVWPLDSERLSRNVGGPAGQRREVVLWDLGGQAEYRLVHQLFLHDTTLALVMLDPTRGQTAFQEVEAWTRRLDLQLHGRPSTKLLIGAKLDQPSEIIDRHGLGKLQQDCGFTGYFETSALNGRGVTELCEVIGSLIDWEAISETSRPELFQQIRDEIDTQRARGEVILHLSDLHKALGQKTPTREETEAVNTVTGQLAAQAVIARANVSSGESVLVLQIEEVERYAGSLIMAARSNPRDVPALELQAIGRPDFALPGIKAGDRLPRVQERAVLECTVQLFLEHGICFQHEGLLIFPSLFPAPSSVDLPSLIHAVSLYYDFAGAIDNVYASLITWLVLARDFGRVRLWSDRAEFDLGNRGLCGLRKVPRPGGFAHVDVYFQAGTSSEQQQMFINFVEEHLRKHGMAIQERAEIICPCGNIVEDEIVRRRMARGDKDVACSVCETRHNLVEGAAASRQRNPRLEGLTWALKTEIASRRKQSTQQAVDVIEKTRQTEQASGRIRILHLSDLHFTADTLATVQLQWLLEDLKQLGHGTVQFDFLVISGDFTDRGRIAGFDSAYRFVSDLTKALDLSAERCILVPGNHDVTDLIETYEWREDSAGLADGDWVRQGDIILARNEAKYKDRLKAFSDSFYHVFLQRPYPLDPLEQGFSIPFWDTGIQFLALNSCWRIDRFHRKRAGMYPGAMARVVEDARKQEADAHRSGLLATDRSVLRIAVWHHAITGPDQIQDTTFLGHLQKLGVRIALHGDVHEMTRDLVAYWHPDNIHVVGSGSFGADKGAMPESVPRMYNILEIDRGLGSVRVHTRCQPKVGGPWKGWHEWPDPAGGEGALPYYDFEL
jgi:WD40 repeat protein